VKGEGGVKKGEETGVDVPLIPGSRLKRGIKRGEGEKRGEEKEEKCLGLFHCLVVRYLWAAPKRGLQKKKRKKKKRKGENFRSKFFLLSATTERGERAERKRVGGKKRKKKGEKGRNSLLNPCRRLRKKRREKKGKKKGRGEDDAKHLLPFYRADGERKKRKEKGGMRYLDYCLGLLFLGTEGGGKNTREGDEEGGENRRSAFDISCFSQDVI